MRLITLEITGIIICQDFMKVLVTGATGLVGREIVAELSNHKVAVTQVGGKSSAGNIKTIENSDARKIDEFFAADISDFESLREIEKIGTVDAVIHSAGLAHQFGNTARESFQAVNVLGTKNVLRLAVKLKARQFILISSTAVYGIKRNPEEMGRKISDIEITEDALCEPETFYAESKLEAEQAAREHCEANKIALTILRLAPVVGEESAGNSARLIEAIEAGRFLWVGAGENYKTLVYKRDVARACLRVLLNKKGGTEIFNIAAEPLMMAEFVRIIAKNSGKPIPPVKIPAAILRIAFRLNRKTFGIKKINNLADTFEKWLSDDVYSAEKIRRVYNFKTETSIEAAMEKQIEAYKRNRKESVK